MHLCSHRPSMYDPLIAVSEIAFFHAMKISKNPCVQFKNKSVDIYFCAAWVGSQVVACKISSKSEAFIYTYILPSKLWLYNPFYW